MKDNYLTLAIDTSCDETSASVVQGLTVLSNIQPSQMEYHKKFGGVVPSLAKLAHEERIDNVVEEALKRAKIKIEEVDYIAVTEGPGLAIALEVGIKKAKELAKKYKKPLMPVNHMEGHMFSGFAKQQKLKNLKTEGINRTRSESKIENRKPKTEKPLNTKHETRNFPALGLLVSGNHTEIILANSIGDYLKVGETLDDSCGECFDKSGRILGLGYPAGALISKFAQENRNKFKFEQVNNNKSVLIRATSNETGKAYELPISMANSGDLNFSYSGLKTAFRQLVESITKTEFNPALDRFDNEKEIARNLKKNEIMDLCVILEAAAYRPIEIKLVHAIQKYNPKSIWMGGGVVASARLRYLIRKIAAQNELTFVAPTLKKLTTDNAAMIGLTANINLESNSRVKILNDENEVDSLDRDPSLSL